MTYDFNLDNQLVITIVTVQTKFSPKFEYLKSEWRFGTKSFVCVFSYFSFLRIFEEALVTIKFSHSICMDVMCAHHCELSLNDRWLISAQKNYL